MSRYCRYKGISCVFATEYGYCQSTACMKEKRISMALDEQKTGYTIEHIMEHTTDGTDEWNATRKEKLIRCKDCVHYLRDNTMVDGWCYGKRKYETGFCDEAILK